MRQCADPGGQMGPWAERCPHRNRQALAAPTLVHMWGLLAVLAGGLYGWLGPGRSDKGGLLWNGFLLGIVLALVLALLGAAIGAPPLPLGAGLVGVVLTILVLTVLFVVGAWLGDALAGLATRERRAA